MRVVCCAMMFLVALSACGQSSTSSTSSGSLRLQVRHPTTLHLQETQRRAVELAIKNWRERLDLAANDAERALVYSRLGEFYLAHRFHNAASDALGIATRLLPDRLEWSYLRAVAEFRGHDLNASLASLNRVLAQSDLKEALQLRAQIRLIQGRIGPARIDVEQLLESDDQARTIALAAEVALYSGEFSEASALLEQAISLQPEANSLYAMLAVSLREQGKVKSARAAWRKAGTVPVEAIDPLLDQVEALARDVPFYIARGKRFLTQRKYSRASKEFLSAVDLSPSHAQAKLFYGRALELSGEVESALTQYREAIASQESFPVAHYFLGALLERSDQFSPAKEHYQLAVDQDPEYLAPRLLLAHSLFRERQYGRAIEHYRRVAMAQKRNTEALYFMGLSWLALGNCEEGVAAFSKAMQVRDKDRHYMEAVVRSTAYCSHDQAAISQAQKIAQKLKDSWPDARTLHALAMTYASQGEFAEAAGIQQSAIKLAVDRDVKTMEEALIHYQSRQRPTEAWPVSDDVYRGVRLTSIAAK